jgi:LPXTG-motif cell wall-anchored protein
MNPNAAFDGGLLGLLLAAMGGLLLRRRRGPAGR